jgi:hypothetical protein
MIDWVGYGIQGFTTGFGVIIAHECWDGIKEYKKRAGKVINGYIPKDNE